MAEVAASWEEAAEGIPRLAPASPAGPSEARFAPLEREVLAHLFRLSPLTAVGLGIHSYDGRLPDLSVPATTRWARRAREAILELRALDVHELPAGRRLDRDLLVLRLQSELFDLTEYPYLERLPLVYVSPLELTPYISRAYAAAPQRAAAMVRALEGAPTVLRAGIARLKLPLPRAFIEVGLSIAEGLAPHYLESESFVRKEAPDLVPAYRKAREEAQAACAEFLAHLNQAKASATEDFALGPALFQRLLYVREGSRQTFQDLAVEGWANLRANQARLQEIATTSRPDGSVEALLASLARDHPSAESLLPETEQYLQELREFLLKRDIISVPTPEHCRVEPTPLVDRAWTTASMDPPGPFETDVYEGVYHVTPVEPDWDATKQEQWLASFNRPILRNVSVHEVYPGHYVQYLHARAHAPSLTRRVYSSGSFTEGWAHYTEQMMVEQGFGGGAPEAEVAELTDALLRNARLVASIGMHTQGMTVEQATQLFVREARMERFPAEREAMRGTFNPEYYCYTLGKLAILKARKAYREARPGATLKEFHDRLLSFGAPPVGFLESLLLEDAVSS